MVVVLPQHLFDHTFQYRLISTKSVHFLTYLIALLCGEYHNNFFYLPGVKLCLINVFLVVCSGERNKKSVVPFYQLQGDR